MIDYDTAQRALPPQRPSFLLWIFAEMGWFVLCAAGGALCVIGIGFLLGVSLGFWSLLLALLTAVALAIRARLLRRSRAMLAVNYLEQAVRLNLPIPSMLAAAEASERSAMRRRLGRLRAEIEAGSPLGIALQRTAPGAPPRVIGLITAGERLGRLPQVLRRSATTEHALLRGRRRALQSIFLRWYPMLFPVVVLPVYFLIMIFVMPKFKQLFSDFGLQMPGVTLWLLGAWDDLAWPLIVIAILGMAVICARMFADLFPLRRPPPPRLRLFDRFAWSVPPWRGVVRHRALGDACHVMADALNAGQPADRAILDASEVSRNSAFRALMLEWARRVSEGASLGQAAQQAAMPSLLTGMLRTACDSAGTAEVLSFLARYYDGRYSKAAALLEGAAVPLMVLVMAAFVLTLALGLFLPMIRLMEHLSQSRWVM